MDENFKTMNTNNTDEQNEIFIKIWNEGLNKVLQQSLPKMAQQNNAYKYAIQILETELKNEKKHRWDAIQELNPSANSAMINKAMSKETENAFVESIRLAEARIPDLEFAISKLKNG